MSLSDGDRREIIELAARYSWELDVTRDAAAVAATFTEDGLFVGDTGAVSRGRAQLVRHFERTWERWARRSPLRHWTTNHVITGDGDEATHTCYILLIALEDAGPRVDRTGIYRDALKRVDGRWLFAERHVSIDQYPRS
ncbi:MAG: nuclear transport factor 2 family protein [Chloroflexi bacterium]|nr:nuclear transport factor 2 family protein [Chloroflexota bacterium]